MLSNFLNKLAFDKFVAISPEITSFLVERGISDEVILPIVTGVNPNEFRPPISQQEKTNLRKELGIPADKKMFLFVGRLVRGKGLDTLMQAWKLVEKLNKNCVLVIVGDINKTINKKTGQIGHPNAWANSLAEAEIKVKNLGLENVMFTGFKTNTCQYMTAADVFVFPSLSEGLPNVVIEAMMSGLPVIASSIPGNTDLIADEVNGLLFEPGNSKELAENMAILLNSPQICLQFGAVNREIALQKFDIELVGQSYLQLLKS